MRDSRIEHIFTAALEKGSVGERAAFIEGACGSDVDLRARVETLLRAHDDAGRFLDPTSEPSPAEGPGTVIGRYKLLQVIGEGGFGVVYMAEQLEPVRRRVAIKIIKLGMDTKQVVARFESERQALALMDHPNIARVLDAGATDAGRPFFVMELVKGIPITEYCDKNNVSTSERLELFIPVCQAVQHAHQKGIIHRDLKPTNVLVTLHDGRPVPKVIDFGIAKATNQRLTEKTLFTEFRQFIGTPQYMSPEQAEMSGLDIDTRSDIYSLGVLLYELLTATTPFEAERLRTAGYGEIQRIIREEEPPSPSVRVSTMRDDLLAIAKHRSAEPATLSKGMCGDLDWIVMRCLEKDRTRRYETASELVADILRHLKHEPVHASPPSAVYRVRKFVRRNRAGVTAGSLVAAALLLGLTLATAGFMRASREAERAGREATRASQEAARSQAIADFLQEILASVDPEEAAKRNLDVQSVSARARELFGNDHATVAATLSSLALQLEHSGNLAAAEPLYRESVRIWRGLYGDNHANVGITLGRLGTLLRHKGDDDAAEQALREALRVTRDLPGESGLLACDTRSDLAEIMKRRGKLDEAETLLRESLAIRRARPGGQEHEIAGTLESLTNVLIMAGKDQETEQVFEEMLAAYRPLFPPDSLSSAWIHLAYGMWLRQRGRDQKSGPYLQEAVRIYRGHPNPPRELYLAAVDGLFQLMRKREEAVGETISLFREAMKNMAYLYGPDHLLLAPHLLGFAKELEARDRAVEAIPLVIEGIRIHRKAKGDDWDATPSLQMLDRFVRRVVLAPGLTEDKCQAVAKGAEALLSEKPDDESYRNLLGMAQYRLGLFDEALKNLEPTGEGASREDAEHSQYRLGFLAMTHYRLGNAAKSRSALGELRGRMAQSSDTPTKDVRAVLSEAEAMITDKESSGPMAVVEPE